MLSYKNSTAVTNTFLQVVNVDMFVQIGSEWRLSV